MNIKVVRYSILKWIQLAEDGPVVGFCRTKHDNKLWLQKIKQVYPKA
jgi:hypothetical protein